jgi:signal peptidase I
MHTGVALQNRIATFEVQSHAMDPTIRKGSKLAIERFYYSANRLERWHIVLVLLSHTETNLIPTKLVHTDASGKQQEFARPHFPYIKRVVGLPGETVKFTDTEIHINGKPLAVPDDLAHCYAGFPGSKAFSFAAADYRVPDDEIFVLSDNVKQGIDSRHIGAVPLRCVLGRAAS